MKAQPHMNFESKTFENYTRYVQTYQDFVGRYQNMKFVHSDHRFTLNISHSHCISRGEISRGPNTNRYLP